MSDESVTITKEEYQQLKDDSLKLSCLYQGGVEDWNWYDEAIELYESQKENR